SSPAARNARPERCSPGPHRDTRFEPATFTLGTLVSPLSLLTLPSYSSRLSVSGRPKTSRVALEVGCEVGSFSAFAAAETVDPRRSTGAAQVQIQGQSHGSRSHPACPKIGQRAG